MADVAPSGTNSSARRLAEPELRQALLRSARRRLPADEVEDLVQMTLTEALSSNSPPAAEVDFQRWVHGILNHKIADCYRVRGRAPTLQAELELAACDPLPPCAEFVDWVQSELPNTEHAQKTLHWLLREGDGETLDEIAREAALPAPRVRQRVSRLRRHFQLRWLALGVSGLLLILAVGGWMRSRHLAQGVPPSIMAEVPTPLEQAQALRNEALEYCARGAYRDCLAKLDRARALDPSGEAAVAIHDARSTASLALEPAPLAAPALAPPLEPKLIELRKTSPRPSPRMLKKDTSSKNAPPFEPLDRR